MRFLWELRAKLGKDKLISADTSATPWVGSDGNPSNDLSGVSGHISLDHCKGKIRQLTCLPEQFATLLDFITIMASVFRSHRAFAHWH